MTREEFIKKLRKKLKRTGDPGYDIQKDGIHTRQIKAEPELPAEECNQEESKGPKADGQEI
ncbi:MAG: hypothetical protein HUJ93_02305 [Bacteroidales bacterium]|nr:hypothetical protein [Bacteroidales bacterium]